MSISNNFPISSKSEGSGYYIPTVTQSGSDYILAINSPEITEYKKGQIINIERTKDIIEYTDTAAIPVFTSNSISNTYGTWKTDKYEAWTSTGRTFDEAGETFYVQAPPETEFLINTMSVYWSSSVLGDLVLQISSAETATGGKTTPMTGSMSGFSSYDAGTLSTTVSNPVWANRIIFKVNNGSSYSSDIPVSNFRVTTTKVRKYVNSDGYGLDFFSPYININGLGVKVINGTIQRGARYSLMYNGTSWDVLPNSSFDVGYLGDAVPNTTKTYTKNLGYEPQLVILFNEGNLSTSVAGNNASSNSVSLGATTPRIITRYVGGAGGEITKTGFVANIHNSSNGSSAKVYFVAFH